jgi:hypothetical protein
MTLSKILGLTLALALTVATLAQAQSGVTLAGVQGGATVSYSSTSGFFSNTIWGGTAGLMIGRTFGQNVQANLEANWVQMGGNNTRVSYIDIPLLIGGGIVGGWGTIVRGYGGVSVGFEVSCSTSGVVDACPDVKSTQWTIPVGLMFGKWMDNGVFVGIDTRWVWGLSDVFENSSTKNNSLQFRLVVGKQLGGSR